MTNNVVLRNSRSIFGRVVSLRRITITNAVKLTEWSTISDDDLGIVTRKKSISEMVSKMKPFTDSLKRVPESGTTSYLADVEENSGKIVAYVKANAVLALGSKVIEQEQVDILCSPATYDIKESKKPNTEIIASWGQYWADFSVDFLKAVSIRVQQRVDIRDRFEGLDLTAEEVENIEKDLRKISFLTASFSAQTSSPDYISGTTQAAKRADLAVFKEEVAKASALAKIVSATIANIPTKAIFKAKLAFNKNPKDSETRKALDKAVVSYKKSQVEAWRKDKSNYKVEEHFNFD